jgi:serine/threonine-protein kinase
MLGESLKRRHARRRTKRPAGGSPGPWRPLLWILPLALAVPFVIGYIIAVYLIFPPAQTAAEGIPVPDLGGSSIGEAEAVLAAAGLGGLDVMELPHPTAAAGTIIAQSPLPGQQLRPGAGVRVAISQGRARVRVPDVQGFAADRADALLRRTGFAVVYASEQSMAAAGRVLRTDPPAGQELILPATVTIVASAGPPAPPPPDTIPPDTIPGW